MRGDHLRSVEYAVSEYTTVYVPRLYFGSKNAGTRIVLTRVSRDSSFSRLTELSSPNIEALFSLQRTTPLCLWLNGLPICQDLSSPAPSHPPHRLPFFLSPSFPFSAVRPLPFFLCHPLVPCFSSLPFLSPVPLLFPPERVPPLPTLPPSSFTPTYPIAPRTVHQDVVDPSNRRAWSAADRLVGPLPNSCNHVAPRTDRESGLNRRLVYGATRLGSSVVTTAFQILLITLAVKRLGIGRISNTSCLRGACFESIRDASTSDGRVDRVARHTPRSAHDRSCVPRKCISQWISRQEERVPPWEESLRIRVQRRKEAVNREQG